MNLDALVNELNNSKNRIFADEIFAQMDLLDQAKAKLLEAKEEGRKRANFIFYLFRRQSADTQAVVFGYLLHNVRVDVIAADVHRKPCQNAAPGNHRCVGNAATHVQTKDGVDFGEHSARAKSRQIGLFYKPYLMQAAFFG